MKQKILMVVLMVAGGVLWGQTPHVPPLDTLRGKECTYFYPTYFWQCLDTCHSPFRYKQIGSGTVDYGQNHSWKYYTDTTIHIVGVALVAKPTNDWPSHSPDAWEALRYLNVVLYDAGEGELIPLEQGYADLYNPSRWMEFSTGRYLSEGGMETFVEPIEEVYFDKPIRESDSFYVGLTGPQGFQSVHVLVGSMFSCPFWDVTMAFWGMAGDYWHYRGCSFLPFIFPIIDSTGWYLWCAQYECPGVDEVSVAQSAGMAIVHWECDTMEQSLWQVSYGPEGTPPGGGRVLECRDRYTMLYGLEDTVHYVVYVRGYCVECSKWGEWSEGVGVYVGELGLESVKDARGVDVVPNPVSGRFEVRSEVEIVGVEVHDARGVTVARSEAKGCRAELDASGWAAGVYIVTVHTRGGTERRRVVVE